jgi:ATP-binding cassette subfamily B protein
MAATPPPQEQVGADDVDMGRRKHDAPRILTTGRAFVRRFRSEIRAERRLISGAFLALITQALLRLLEPWPLGLVIDALVAQRGDESTALPAMAEKLAPLELFLFAAVAIVAIAVARAIAGYSGTIGFALVGNRVLTRARERVFRHLQSLSLAFHTRSRSGDIVVRVIGDVGTVRDVTVTALLPLLMNGLVLAGMLSVMLWLDARLTAAALITVPLFWLTMIRLGRRIQTVSRKQRRQEGDLASTAAESLVGIETVQALSLGERFSAAFGRQNAGSMREGVKAKRLSARLERTVDVLAALATGLVLYFGARLALNGELRPGELVIFMSYLKTAIRPVRAMAKYTARLAKASAAAERVLEILDEVPEIDDAPDAVEATDIRGDVAFESVALAYPTGEPSIDESARSFRPVLQGIDLAIPAGARVAVIGESGAGKSTLTSALLRLIDPVAGRVTLDGENLRRFTVASLRRQIAVVPQEALLFTGSIAENIAMARPESTPDEIEESARAACAHAFIEALPRGYATPLGERGADLSVGQRRRLSIARASLSRAPVVILDEPLAGLDPENRQAVELALSRSIEGRTTFLVTHDVEQALESDLVIALDSGRIAEWGPPSELLARDGFLSRWHRFSARSVAPTDRHREVPHARLG